MTFWQATGSPRRLDDGADNQVHLAKEKQMRRNVRQVFNVLLVVVATAAAGSVAIAQDRRRGRAAAVAAGAADVDLRRRRC